MTTEQEETLSDQIGHAVNTLLDNIHSDLGRPQMDADPFIRGLLIALTDMIVKCSDDERARANGAARCINFIVSHCNITPAELQSA